MTCDHPAFNSSVEVEPIIRDGSPVGFRVDVQLSCRACGELMVFFGTGGLPLAPSEAPKISADGTTIRLPVRPLSADPHSPHLLG